MRNAFWYQSNNTSSIFFEERFTDALNVSDHIDDEILELFLQDFLSNMQMSQLFP